jgi:hypothetical protein
MERNLKVDRLSERKTDEWKAIEKVAVNKEDEIRRKLGYALSYIEHGLTLLKRLKEEIKSESKT